MGSLEPGRQPRVPHKAPFCPLSMPLNFSLQSTISAYQVPRNCQANNKTMVSIVQWVEIAFCFQACRGSSIHCIATSIREVSIVTPPYCTSLKISHFTSRECLLFRPGMLLRTYCGFDSWFGIEECWLSFWSKATEVYGPWLMFCVLQITYRSIPLEGAQRMLNILDETLRRQKA